MAGCEELNLQLNYRDRSNGLVYILSLVVCICTMQQCTFWPWETIPQNGYHLYWPFHSTKLKQILPLFPLFQVLLIRAATMKTSIITIKQPWACQLYCYVWLLLVKVEIEYLFFIQEHKHCNYKIADCQCHTGHTKLNRMNIISWSMTLSIMICNMHLDWNKKNSQLQDSWCCTVSQQILPVSLLESGKIESDIRNQPHSIMWKPTNLLTKKPLMLLWIQW